MSASLVGSEMCIRDSDMLAHAPCRHPETLSWLITSRQMASLSAQRAVSYTHLTLPTICSV
eukprot:966522-Alexandrium_andersonii.AAC.1